MTFVRPPVGTCLLCALLAVASAGCDTKDKGGAGTSAVAGSFAGSGASGMAASSGVGASGVAASGTGGTVGPVGVTGDAGEVGASGTAASGTGVTGGTGASGTAALGTGGTSGSGTGGAGGTNAGAGGTNAGAGGANAGAGGTSAGSGGAGGADDLCDVGVYDGTPPEVLNLSGNTFAHDPTMIEADGVFYRFWTGDNIPMATSTNLTSWQNAPPVYSGGYSSWVAPWLAGIPGEMFNFPWAPDVSYFGGQYHIYSSFSAIFGDNISCITHLTTDDIASGDWTDHGPVICTEGNEPYNAIDPDVGLDADGTAWLAFGSFWDGIMAFELDSNGDRVGSELTRLAWAREIEGPVLFRRCGYYYLFVSWGICCPGGSRSVNDLTYRVVVGRSDDILGPYVDRDGKDMLDGGGTLVVQGGGNFAAAGHSDVLVSGDKIYHLYHAYRLPNGNAELRTTEMPFDDEGWPVPAGP